MTRLDATGNFVVDDTGRWIGPEPVARLSTLGAEIEAHEAHVGADDPALFLVDLHHAVLDALDRRADLVDLVDVADWLTQPGTQVRARRWLAAADTGATLSFGLLMTALREAMHDERSGS